MLRGLLYQQKNRLPLWALAAPQLHQPGSEDIRYENRCGSGAMRTPSISQ